MSLREPTMELESRSSKYDFLIHFWPRIHSHLSNKHGYSVSDFVVLDKTFPDCIQVRDFSTQALLNGQKLSCRLPTTVQVDADNFPILSTLSEEELSVFSPMTEPEFSLEDAVYGPLWGAYSRVGEPGIKAFLSMDEGNYKRYIFVKIASASPDQRHGMVGEPLKQFALRLAAVRLFQLTKAYDFFCRAELEFRRNYHQELSHDSFGNEDISSIASGVARICKRHQWEADEQTLIDIIAFSSGGESPTRDEDWRAYERSCAETMRELGFQVMQTSEGRDFGADLICEKDDLTYIVQCKLHSKPVGIKAVQEIVAARKFYASDYAVVMGEGGFTSAAEELARRNHVVLVSRSTAYRIEAECISRA